MANYNTSDVAGGDDALALQYNNIRDDVDQSGGFYDDTGTADSYQISPNSNPSSYKDGDTYLFKAANANTGASTLNVNSIGAKSLVKKNGEDLTADEIKSGELIIATYDNDNDEFLANGPSISREFNEVNDIITSGNSVSKSEADGYSGSITIKTISGNTLGTQEILRGVVDITGNFFSLSDDDTYKLSFTLKLGGNTIHSFTVSSVDDINNPDFHAAFDFEIVADGSTSSQIFKGKSFGTTNEGEVQDNGGYSYSERALDMTLDQDLVLDWNASDSSGDTDWNYDFTFQAAHFELKK